MDIQLVFNELCLFNLEDDEYKARELMSNFIQTLREALEQGIQQQFMTVFTILILPLVIP
jgi:hypothetical protein